MKGLSECITECITKVRSRRMANAPSDFRSLSLPLVTAKMKDYKKSRESHFYRVISLKSSLFQIQGVTNIGYSLEGICLASVHSPSVR